MKYVSIDIETTGLDPKVHSIIEFGAVVDDLCKPIEEVRKFRAVVVNEQMVVDPYCALLHARLWKELLEAPKLDGKDVVVRGDTHYVRSCALIRVFEAWLQWDGKYTVAGKNFAMFDAKFLGPMTMRHRVLDPGSMFVRAEDDQMPDMAECLRRAGIVADVPHTAVDDAMLVVRLVRVGLKNA